MRVVQSFGPFPEMLTTNPFRSRNASTMGLKSILEFQKSICSNTHGSLSYIFHGKDRLPYGPCGKIYWHVVHAFTSWRALIACCTRSIKGMAGAMAMDWCLYALSASQPLCPSGSRKETTAPANMMAASSHRKCIVRARLLGGTCCWLVSWSCRRALLISGRSGGPASVDWGDHTRAALRTFTSIWLRVLAGRVLSSPLVAARAKKGTKSGESKGPAS